MTTEAGVEFETPLERTEAWLPPVDRRELLGWVNYDFVSFLHSQRGPLARAVAAWMWNIQEFGAISSRELGFFVDRGQLIDLVGDAAPWDDNFIAYAQRPSLRRMRTAWFLAVGFGEPEHIASAASTFLKFCWRQGLRRPAATGRQAELAYAICYIQQWQDQVTRRLIGPILDRMPSVADTEFDDDIPF